MPGLGWRDIAGRACDMAAAACLSLHQRRWGLLGARWEPAGRPFSSSQPPPRTHCHWVPAHGIDDHLVPFRLPRSVVAALCDVDVDGWDPSLARGASIKLSDSSALKLRRRAMVQWPAGKPSEVLIVKKPRAPAASMKLLAIAEWLSCRGIRVLVEQPVHATETPQFEAYDPARHSVDFCITLGGDGTVLHLASLFEEQDEPLPPVISFAMGTLGFLTPFDAGDYENCLTRVLNSHKEPLFCTLRTRKRCEMRFGGGTVATHHVLNECVIDRGTYPGAVNLELFIDGSFVTNIEADGLIIASPSGSTAYSMSAGGPMIAPSVPGTILTPIAPLSLSFRPLVIPESSDIVIHLPAYARSHARCSFDGKHPVRMRKDSSLLVSTSLCPLPMINLGTLDSDWYEGIVSKLRWNQSIRQPPKLPGELGRPKSPVPGMSLNSTSGATYNNGNGAAMSAPLNTVTVAAAAAAPSQSPSTVTLMQGVPVARNGDGQAVDEGEEDGLISCSEDDLEEEEQRDWLSCKVELGQEPARVENGAPDAALADLRAATLANQQQKPAGRGQ